MVESAFFQDLAMLMAVAGLVSALFARLRWPKVIGYILAGVLLSRHTWGGSFLVDESSVRTIGQLGVVFLMFTMGLEFSTAEMKRVKNVALPTALLDSMIMVWIGYTVGRNVFHWGTVPSLFLGAAICDSATTLLAKIIGEMNWSSRPFVKFVIGTSVCEDVICVGLIALITGVARGQGMDLSAVGTSLGALAVFFLTTLVVGFVLVPRLLTTVAKRGDDETLLLSLLGCGFFVTYLAYWLEFSLALGAFLVGVLGSASDVRTRLHRLLEPLRSMFAAVFFVSIGLLVNPVACWDHFAAILLLSAVVMLGKGVNCFAGALVTGERLKTAVQMSFGLAQIGEFGYMVAMLYLTITGDTASPMYQIVVGVSLLTTILNPLMLRASDPVGDWLETHCSRRVHRWLDAYRGALARYREAASRAGANENREVVRQSVIELVVVGVLEFAVAVSMSMLAARDWSNLSAFLDLHKRLVFCLLANVFVVGMLAPIFMIGGRLGNGIGTTLTGAGEAHWQLAIRNVTRHAVRLMVMALAFVGMLMINVNLAPAEPWARVTLEAAILLLSVFGWRFFLRAGRRAAVRFGEAMKVDERLAAISREVTFSLPGDAVAKLRLDVASPAIGGTVVSLNIRAKTGASIVAVEREGRVLRGIGPELEFKVGDVLVAIGDGAQIAALKDLLGIVA